jgi:hypothetical protein
MPPVLAAAPPAAAASGSAYACHGNMSSSPGPCPACGQPMRPVSETAGHGQWVTITCVTVTCSRCGMLPDGEDFTPYFDSPAQAREQLPRDYGGRITPLDGGGGEELLCCFCAAKDDCGRLGHQPAPGGPYLILPSPQLAGAYTWCDRCGEPIPPVVPVGGAAGHRGGGA